MTCILQPPCNVAKPLPQATKCPIHILISLPMPHCARAEFETCIGHFVQSETDRVQRTA